ncbi:uncharacterized protein LOC119402392 [Rhipicephalus sanguineus]|uniref:uncharacterized protein LOC119402392 n=1 Tax=Rhipicephalus sanguineus TaxID=34632 RepID=UPI0020C52A21|nr:uncharacterized protein LOC119402392 [Rhipicephalus sanguineus]
MAAPKPTHAYVEYKDGDKAIVAVSLIKRYSPNDVTELANNKLVCWRKSRKGYVADRYIRGDVLTLGYGIDDLVARMLKQGKIVPKKVLEDSSQGIRLKKSTLQGAKQRQHHSKVPKKPATSKISGKRCREDLDSETEEEEEEQVPRRLLQEAENKIAELEERLRVSEERLHEERQQNIKLQNLLEQKMDSMEASIIAAIKSEQHGARLASQNSQQEARAVRQKRAALHKDWGAVNPRKETPVAADPQPSQPSSVLPPREEQAGSEEAVAAPSSPGSPNIDEPEQTQPEMDMDAPLFKPVNGKRNRRERSVKLRRQDVGLRFLPWTGHPTKESTVPEFPLLRTAHVTGHALSCHAVHKIAMLFATEQCTHSKVAYYHFVKAHPNTLHTVDRRLRDLNKHLASFLQDVDKKERLSSSR